MNPVGKIRIIVEAITKDVYIQNILLENTSGGNYSNLSYDFTSATRNNIIYPSKDLMIFEIKFPNKLLESISRNLTVEQIEKVFEDLKPTYQLKLNLC